MTDEIVMVVTEANISYRDSSHFEEADSALRAALALNCILSDMTTGENAGMWSNHVVSDLHEADRLLMLSARESLGRLRRENWRAHALLGEYGPEAKARAEVEDAVVVAS
jgi:hypothetical protein